MPKLIQLNTLFFLLIVLSFLSYGCGKKTDPISPSKKIVSTKNCKYCEFKDQPDLCPARARIKV